MQVSTEATTTVVDLDSVPNWSTEPFADHSVESKNPRTQAYKKDAEVAGLVVVKLLGRLTALDPSQKYAPLCFRIQRDKKKTPLKNKYLRGEDINPKEFRCLLMAGIGTAHVGAGACKAHGGNNYGISLITKGERATKLRYEFANVLLGGNGSKALAAWLADFEITDELIVQRQMLNQYLNDNCLDADKQPISDLPENIVEKVIAFATEVTKTVERGKRLETNDAVTRVHLMYLVAALTELGKRYVMPEHLENYGRELLNTFGISENGIRGLLEPGKAEVSEII